MYCCEALKLPNKLQILKDVFVIDKIKDIGKCGVKVQSWLPLIDEALVQEQSAKDLEVNFIISQKLIFFFAAASDNCNP